MSYRLEAYLHLKSGKKYYRVTRGSPLINATNENEGQEMILYKNESDQFFVREYNEFMKKFSPIIEEEYYENN